MKRTHSQADDDNESEDTEMEVESEEKADRSEDEDLEENPETSGRSADNNEEGEGSFLDTFYGLSSANPRERAEASQAMLYYCLLGPEANTKDATYALRRLFRGLCSGRAAARQGNASVLASFLKIAFQQGTLKDIQKETVKEGEEEASILCFVRRHLIDATDPSDSGGEGRKRGSEERDYHFGRLFGILGVIRSGILLPSGDVRADLGDIIEVTSALVDDLAGLYSYKKWMREPAAHAVGTLLNTFYVICPENSDAVKVVEHLVENNVVPKFLLAGDLRSDEGGPLFASYSAEQVAISANIQTHVQFHQKGLPKPLDKAILTRETTPLIASALSETSVVTQPRTHLVWDSIWPFLTESDDKQKTKTVDVRRSRERCTVGDESVHDVMDALLRHVVIEKLLGIDETADKRGKTTHERRALALCIVRNLLGVEFVSSIAGRIQLRLEPQDIESVVLCPILVRRLFIDVIAAGKGGKKQSEHMLKPLALQVLDSIVQCMDSVADADADVDGTVRRRLSVARAFLKCDPRFDNCTKTSTVASLLQLAPEIKLDKGVMMLWDECISFLMHQIASSGLNEDERRSTGVSSYESAGYVDALFNLAKRIIRIELGSEQELATYKSNTIRRILGFLMAGAFFDCKSVSTEAAGSSTKKQKKKSKNGSAGSAAHTELFVFEAAGVIKAHGTGTLPYFVRDVLSARFFSLLADIVGTSVHPSSRNTDLDILDLLIHLEKSWKQMDSSGARRFLLDGEDDEDGRNVASESETIVSRLQEQAKSFSGVQEKRFAVGCALLSSTLHLHLLGCGRPEGDIDDPDADEDDFEEVTNTIADVHHVAEQYLRGASQEENSLLSLTELCANILSSPLSSGSQSRGASPRLLREAVRLTWIGGLNLSVASKDACSLSSEVITVLLNSIGCFDDGTDGDEDEMKEDESERDDDEGSEQSEDNAVFAEASQVEGLLDDDDMGDEKSNNKSDAPIGEDSENEMELNPEKLQSMLEEDIDDADLDDDVLEHHEGADAALAKLIQLKQEARKAGQLARERLEIARQLRCTLLLDTLVIGKPDGWGALLRSDIVLRLVVPLMAYRRDLEKSLTRATVKGSDGGSSEKRALLERLTLLLKSKIFKIKVSPLDWMESIDISDFTVDYASKLMLQANERVSKEHRACCSLGLLLMLRAIPDTEARLKAAEVYATAVSEWATKRTTRLESSLFDDLIHQSPPVAQATLVQPLVTAVSTARSAFLKSESLRLLSLLYNPKINQYSSDLDKLGMERLVDASDSVLEAIIVSLKDPEMTKTKRIREVLKSGEKVVVFLASSVDQRSESKHMHELVKLLDEISAGSDSQGVQSDCENLRKAVQAQSEVSKVTKDYDSADNEGNVQPESLDESPVKQGKSKKKRKKSKKKKHK